MITSLCPLCQATTTRPLFGPIEQCTGCGLVRTRSASQFESSHPDPKQYGEDYFTRRNLYLPEQAAFLKMFASTLDRLQPFKASGKLLDIGCGPGLLLKVALERGYSAHGCDISEWATAFARSQGLDVRTGVLQELQYRTGEFDIVVLNHTLEHMPDPLGTLHEVYRILANDGALLVGVPNFASLNVASDARSLGRATARSTSLAPYTVNANAHVGEKQAFVYCA
ncbi:MAG: hypothetical protein KatS3mg052_0552 [Candidatus Roseilinea sp.]|nr:MAG: hypothetical protein KatS3mg052_0552 [Candidatus Roseilinea sp.]